MPVLISSVRRPLRRMQAFLAAFAVVLGLGGCTHTWVPGPETGLSPSQLEPAKARCSLMARHGGSSFGASGDVRFVAAATVGYALGDMIRSHEDFDDCMVAGGWQIASAQSNSEQSNMPEHSSMDGHQIYPEKFNFPVSVKGILSVSNECVRVIRSDPKYSDVLQYLGDLDTGKHSMLQLSVMRFATTNEVRAYASLLDRSRSCTTIAITQIELISPSLANTLRGYRQESDARALAVLRQQQTWGDYALQQDHAIDELRMRTGGASL